MANNLEENILEEDFLEVDNPIGGQNYVCLSFISPENVLKQKERFNLVNFLKQVFSDNSRQYSDIRENMTNDKEFFTYDNIDNLYKNWYYQNSTILQEKFDEKNDYKTSVRSVKVRGTYDTLREAKYRAAVLQKRDKSFDVFVGQVGYWLPWDPESDKVKDQEYVESDLNQLMKKYNENLDNRDTVYEQIKQDKLKKAREELATRKEEEKTKKDDAKLMEDLETKNTEDNDETKNADTKNVNAGDDVGTKNVDAEYDDETKNAGTKNADTKNADTKNVEEDNSSIENITDGEIEKTDKIEKLREIMDERDRLFLESQKELSNKPAIVSEKAVETEKSDVVHVTDATDVVVETVAGGVSVEIEKVVDTLEAAIQTEYVEDIENSKSILNNFKSDQMNILESDDPWLQRKNILEKKKNDILDELVKDGVTSETQSSVKTQTDHIIEKVL